MEGPLEGGNHRFADPDNRLDIVSYNVRLARIIAKCGAEHLVFGPGGQRQKPTTLQELKNAAITINEAAKRTYDLGVKACIHPHLWTEIQDENELDELMSLCDPEVVFLAVDTAHLAGAGMDPAAIIRKYQARVAYIHLKDLTSKEAVKADFPMLLKRSRFLFFVSLD